MLIVDDSPVMRSFIKRALSLSGLNLEYIGEAADGRAALEALRESRIDLMLSDINMPRLNGEELVRTMAQNGQLSATPVIVISTDSTRQRVERLLGLGARGYIEKPFRPEALRSEIDRVLEECGA